MNTIITTLLFLINFHFINCETYMGINIDEQLQYFLYGKDPAPSKIEELKKQARKIISENHTKTIEELQNLEFELLKLIKKSETDDEKLKKLNFEYFMVEAIKHIKMNQETKARTERENQENERKRTEREQNKRKQTILSNLTIGTSVAMGVVCWLKLRSWKGSKQGFEKVEEEIAKLIAACSVTAIFGSFLLDAIDIRYEERKE